MRTLEPVPLVEPDLARVGGPSHSIGRIVIKQKSALKSDPARQLKRRIVEDDEINVGRQLDIP